MTQAQPAGQAQATRQHSLRDELREAAYKIFSHSAVNTVLDLVEFGLFVIPYRSGKKPGLRKWQDLEDTEFSLENVIKAWERATVEGTEWYGVMLGRPSNYLVLIDIDSVDATRLLKVGRTGEARKLVERLYEEVKERLPRTRDPDLQVDLLPVGLTLTRRGVHVIVRLSRNDYEMLAVLIGKANAELGEAELAGQKVKVELRLRGATPLHTQWHETEYWQLPLPPISLKRLEKLLQTLGVRLPEASIEEQTSAEKGENENHDVRKHIDRHMETTHSSTVDDTSARETGGRRLSEQEIARLVELLKNYWVPGHRNNLQLGLVGWLIKRGVPQEQAEELVRRLAEAAGDEEVKKRIDEVKRQYRLVEAGQKKLEELLGKAGLLQELQQVIREQNPGLSEEEARDRALAVVAELEKILGPRKSIVIRTPYESAIWIVNDPARGIVLLREKTDENGQVKRHRKYISDWYVRKVLVVRGDGQLLYKVLFRNARTKEKIVLAGSLDEIVRELKRLHGVKRSQHLFDAVSAIISEFIKRRLAKVKKTAAVAGILPVRDTVKLVRTGALSRLLIPKEVDVEKAKQALELLQQLRKHYDPAKFDVAINWAGYAVASYALKKQYHVKQVYLLLHGEKQTGKTTLARIITAMFPVVTSEAEEIPEEGQSEFRLAWKLNVAAVPLLEDEVQGISRKPSLLGLLKRASTGDTARWRGDQNRKYHARAPLVFTSNYQELIEDPALIERIIQVEFTQNDYVFNKPRQEREEFRRLYNEYRAVAHHLGAALLQVIVEHWQYIANEWVHRLQEKTDYLQFGQWIWKQVAERLGVEPPEWSNVQMELEEQRPEEAVREAFWDTLHDIVAEYARLYRCDGTIIGCLARLGREGKLPSTVIEWTPSRIVVKASILKEMENRLGIQVIGGLKNLAEQLGLEYKKVKVRGRVVKGIVVPVKELVKNIGGEEDVVEYLAETLLIKYNMERWGTDDKPLIPKILEEARRLGLDIDYETADKVSLKIMDLAAKHRLEAEEAPA